MSGHHNTTLEGVLPVPHVRDCIYDQLELDDLLCLTRVSTAVKDSVQNYKYHGRTFRAGHEQDHLLETIPDVGPMFTQLDVVFKSALRKERDDFPAVWPLLGNLLKTHAEWVTQLRLEIKLERSLAETTKVKAYQDILNLLPDRFPVCDSLELCINLGLKEKKTYFDLIPDAGGQLGLLARFPSVTSLALTKSRYLASIEIITNRILYPYLEEMTLNGLEERLTCITLQEDSLVPEEMVSLLNRMSASPSWKSLKMISHNRDSLSHLISALQRDRQLGRGPCWPVTKLEISARKENMALALLDRTAPTLEDLSISTETYLYKTEHDLPNLKSLSIGARFQRAVLARSSTIEQLTLNIGRPGSDLTRVDCLRDYFPDFRHAGLTRLKTLILHIEPDYLQYLEMNFPAKVKCIVRFVCDAGLTSHSLDTVVIRLKDGHKLKNTTIKAVMKRLMRQLPRSRGLGVWHTSGYLDYVDPEPRQAKRQKTTKAKLLEQFKWERTAQNEITLRLASDIIINLDSDSK